MNPYVKARSGRDDPPKQPERESVMDQRNERCSALPLETRLEIVMVAGNAV